jgi:predicted nucleic acid-binding protein
MLILVDSGVLLRLMERADPQHGTIRQAVRTLTARGDELVAAFQNVAEFWNVCTRPATSRGGLGLDIGETDRRLRVLERILTILADHPTSYRLWRRLVVTHAVQGRQVHDARLAALMQAHGITHILTLNGSDFTRYPGITPVDPASLVPPPPPASGPVAPPTPAAPPTPPPTTP